MTSRELPAHVQYSFETPSVGGFLVVFCLDGLFGGFLFVCLGGLGDGVVLVVVGVFPVDFPHWMRCSLFVESLPS